MATAISRSMGSIVNLDEGQISREIFVNEEIYAQEQEQVFSKAWLFVGHETQVPKPGDYFVSSMGEESVILCRDREGEIHVFLNSCTHRGMKVCRYDEGNTPVFSCPYHGWSFATDGRLVGGSLLQRGIQGRAGQVAVGPHRSATDAQLQGRNLGVVGQAWAVVHGISGRIYRVSRPAHGRPGRQ